MMQFGAPWSAGGLKPRFRLGHGEGRGQLLENRSWSDVKKRVPALMEVLAMKEQA